MRQVMQKRLVFVAKSMMWSVLLYVALTLAFNYDEVSNAISGGNAITIIRGKQSLPGLPVENPPVAQPDISHNAGLLNGVVTVLKIVAGIAEVSGK